MKLRPATLADIPMLRHWDSQPHVVYATGSNDPYDWDRELPRYIDWREFLIAEIEEKPIGLVVLIDPAREETRYWGDVEPNLRGLDIWIGEEADTGKGYGGQMMRLAIDHCFADPSVTAIIIDPLETNTAAIRFYERLGFRFTGRQQLGGDDIHVMRLDRTAWTGTAAA